MNMNFQNTTFVFFFFPEMCLSGTYSYLGLGPDCLECPKGSFQENRGQRGCEPCFGNSTTSGPGASSVTSCIGQYIL